jgi:hypothetical protein
MIKRSLQSKYDVVVSFPSSGEFAVIRGAIKKVLAAENELRDVGPYVLRLNVALIASR